MKTSEMVDKYLHKKYIGMKVICRSNCYDKPLMIGTIVDILYETHIPFVCDDTDGENYMVMGVVIPWTKEMECMLKTITSEEQWELLSNISLAIQELKR